MNLRQELAKVRRLPGSSSWLTDDGAGSLQLRATSDVTRLLAGLDREDYSDIAEVWRGLGSHRVLDSLELDFLPPTFHDWLDCQNQRVETLFLDALPCRAHELEAIADLKGAVDIYRSLVRMDPLDETAHQEIIRLECLRGRYEAATHQFDRLRETLARELRVSPSQETVDLAEAIPNQPSNRHAVTMSLPASRLPTPVTPFVGRVRETADLEALVCSPRSQLISITGLGGVGKTRLAIELARRTASTFPDGVLFVPLAQLDEAGMLAPYVAALLDIRPDGETVMERLLKHLEGKRMLLLLDNVDRIPAVGDLVNDILVRAESCVVVATSRVPLGLQAECKYPLQGLTFPGKTAEVKGNFDAVDLFVQSARRQPRGFSPSETDLAHIHDICKVLRGLPLAIELAAGLCSTLSIDAIAEELVDGNFDVLASEQQDRPSRHRALRVVLRSTWQMLDDSERFAICRLSVFRRSFQREAARAVSHVSLHTLRRLTEKGLVVREQNGSFLLHDAVRWFAVEQFAHSEDGQRQRVELNVRAAEHYRMLLGSRTPQSIDQLEPWLLAFKHLVMAEEYDDACRFLIKFDVRLLLRWGEAASILELHQSINERLTDQNLQGRSFNSMGLALGRLGRSREAIQCYQDALAISRESGDRVNEANYLGNLGIAYNVSGDLQEAVACHEAAVTISRDLGDLRSLGIDQGCLGLAYKRLGDVQRSITLHQQALETSTKAGDTQSVGNHLGNLAYAFAEQGDATAGLSYAKAALAIRRELRDRRGEAIDLLCLAELHGLLGNVELAADNFDAALTLNRNIGERIGESDVLFRVGKYQHRLSAGTGDHASGLDRVRQALALCRTVGDRHMEAEILQYLGDTFDQAGDETRAAAIWLTALALIPEPTSVLGLSLEAALENVAADPQIRWLDNLLMHGSELLWAATGQAYALPHLDALRRWRSETQPNELQGP